ncbi:helix-turn-helix domain-containing protein [Tsukamurella sp. 8F]|uniref:helix-turn-helix domain-containing protein n=1 Tax=unclassified Tsukamurella TaxID=2633480 RepID=UPI0023B9FDDE|nr:MULTISPECIES: helix-turn-helix domain-containing protein [unclassified Tsukamurella]MDF0531710.1 helix-turn-helix domain-containing protein [Tsukamurella sp. 8J]MDF0588956.1 helix-turn-helix domain-containing protein [Tsukamurella sp. 8F]
MAPRNLDTGSKKPAELSPVESGGGSSFLTVAEVATLMRVSKMTVYRLVHNGELPAVRVGRSFRVHEKAVHDYLQTSYFDAG